MTWKYKLTLVIKSRGDVFSSAACREQLRVCTRNKQKKKYSPYHCSLSFSDLRLFNDDDECADYQDEDETNLRRLSRGKDKFLHMKSPIYYLVSKFLCLSKQGGDGACRDPAG